MRPEPGLRYTAPNFNGEYVNMRPLIFPFPRQVLETVSFAAFSFSRINAFAWKRFANVPRLKQCSFHPRPLVGSVFCIRFPWDKNTISVETASRNVTDVHLKVSVDHADLRWIFNTFLM